MNDNEKENLIKEIQDFFNKSTGPLVEDMDDAYFEKILNESLNRKPPVEKS